MSRVNTRTEWSEWVRNGRAFSIGIGFSAVASTFNILQLWNPVNSGYRFVVAVANQSASTACLMKYWLDSTQITTAVTAATAVNLLAGSSATTRSILTTSQPIAQPAGSLIRFTTVAANGSDIGQQQGMFCELMPGQGLDVATATANIASFMTLSWGEVLLSQYP